MAQQEGALLHRSAGLKKSVDDDDQKKKKGKYGIKKIRDTYSIVRVSS